MFLNMAVGIVRFEFRDFLGKMSGRRRVERVERVEKVELRELS
jgi:hypothetical protein